MFFDFTHVFLVTIVPQVIQPLVILESELPRLISLLSQVIKVLHLERLLLSHHFGVSFEVCVIPTLFQDELGDRSLRLQKVNMRLVRYEDWLWRLAGESYNNKILTCKWQKAQRLRNLASQPGYRFSYLMMKKRRRITHHPLLKQRVEAACKHS